MSGAIIQQLGDLQETSDHSLPVQHLGNLGRQDRSGLVDHAVLIDPNQREQGSSDDSELQLAVHWIPELLLGPMDDDASGFLDMTCNKGCLDSLVLGGFLYMGGLEEDLGDVVKDVVVIRDPRLIRCPLMLRLCLDDRAAGKSAVVHMLDNIRVVLREDGVDCSLEIILLAIVMDFNVGLVVVAEYRLRTILRAGQVRSHGNAGGRNIEILASSWEASVIKKLIQRVNIFVRQGDLFFTEVGWGL